MFDIAESMSSESLCKYLVGLSIYCSILLQIFPSAKPVTRRALSSSCAFTSPCGANSQWCFTSAGNVPPICLCELGYRKSAPTHSGIWNCTDIDECEEEPDLCLDDARCVNYPGSYYCRCTEGYTYNGTNCIDLDECERGEDLCGYGTFCANTIGSYNCSCVDNWKQMDKSTKTSVRYCEGVCYVADEDCSYNGVCVWNNSQLNCLCEEGYTLSIYGQCEACDAIGLCGHNSYMCVYVLAKSSTCMCKDGYEKGNYTTNAEFDCTDKDECSDEEGFTRCKDRSRCVNTDGSYKCVCDEEGYQYKDKKCLDINECLSGGNNCGFGTVCRNTVGSFHCRCRTGHSNMTQSSRSNITFCEEDNCVVPRQACAYNKYCIEEDEEDELVCRCKDGYNATSDGVCEDIDECETGENHCGEGTRCVNMESSYNCPCDVGYEEPRDVYIRHHKNRTCLDVDECIKSTACPKDMTCLNIDGSFDCECATGYAKNDNICQDIDECSIFGQSHSPSLCHAKALCHNSPGSFECQCTSGYHGNGVSCEDTDECQSSHGCDKWAVCINTKGSYSCECQTGYTGDGITCEDVNECDVAGSCQDGQRCSNSPGYFTCMSAELPKESLENGQPNVATPESMAASGSYGRVTSGIIVILCSGIIVILCA